MKSIIKRYLSVVLSVIMLISFLPAAAFAAEEDLTEEMPAEVSAAGEGQEEEPALLPPEPGGPGEAETPEAEAQAAEELIPEEAGSDPDTE